MHGEGGPEAGARVDPEQRDVAALSEAVHLSELKDVGYLEREGGVADFGEEYRLFPTGGIFKIELERFLDGGAGGIPRLPKGRDIHIEGLGYPVSPFVVEDDFDSFHHALLWAMAESLP